MSLGDVAANFGKGLFAGLAGTAATTVSSTLEMKISGRERDPGPSRRGGARHPAERRGIRGPFLQPGPLGLRHWLGSVRGLLDSAGLSGPAATLAHLALVWGSEQVILPALNVSAPVFRYGRKATATDLLHHTVYAAATGIAYSYLDRSQSR